MKISDEQLVPKIFKLYLPFPNPFNPRVTFRYEIFLSSDVNIHIYNIGGEKINSYHQQSLQPGIHEFHWTAISASGTTIPSGIYFYTIESNGIVQSKKLIFMK
jgi:flagellar hook assembly protein FlgD